MLAFSRIPGNALSFWIRRTLRWSRGLPALPHEPKEDLFSYLQDKPARAAAWAREKELWERYRLSALAETSTRALYRKNLYLLDILEKACAGLPLPEGKNGRIKALDMGCQDWHYVFGLERWLRYGNARQAREVFLDGVEVDGYGIYPDFRSRKDYALAYLAQTGNPEVRFKIEDFLKSQGGDYDLITLFYPFVTRHHLLLWGLPLRFFRPGKVISKAAAITRPGGWMLVFTHTLKEHELFLELGKGAGGYELVREGGALSPLVDFHQDVLDRHFSLWRRIN